MAKRKKNKPEWIKETLELKANHRWQSKPGYKVFVAARGAVRFDVPGDWIFEPAEKSFKFTDREAPNDDCCLEVSFSHLPDGDWDLFPLKATLRRIVADDTRNAIATSDVFTVKRQTARIVWAEIKFIDSEENREAFSRICIGLGSNVHCLITFDYWADQADRLTPVWDNVLETLTLGLYIRDPLTGLAFPD